MALTGEHLGAFLAALHPDRQAAGERYEILRRLLLMFFAARHVRAAEDCADEVLDRAARRIAGGVTVAPTIESYVLGIARNIIREQWKGPQPKDVDWARIPSPASGPDPESDCLDQCLAALAPQSRGWIERFYEGKGAARIRGRQALAAELGIDVNALRVRMYRIRSVLEQCLVRCLDPRGNETRHRSIYQRD